MCGVFLGPAGLWAAMQRSPQLWSWLKLRPAFLQSCELRLFYKATLLVGTLPGADLVQQDTRMSHA